MSGWRVLIADDEPAARRGVRQLLAAFDDFTVVAECRNGREALAALDAVKPDLVFLDIQMPDLDGFEVIRRRGAHRMPILVFLTAYGEFALDAFGVQALDYLVKPVSEARFATAMRHARRRLAERAPDDPSARIAVSSPRGTIWLALPDVDWIEADGNYARLWVAGRSHLLRRSLRALERELGPHGFLRAHRRALIRSGAVRALARDDAGGLVAVLASGARVEVSRRRRASFSRAIRRATRG